MADNIIRQDIIQLKFDTNVKELTKVTKEIDDLKKSLNGGVGDDELEKLKKATNEAVKPMQKLKDGVAKVAKGMVDFGKKVGSAVVGGLKKLGGMAVTVTKKMVELGKKAATTAFNGLKKVAGVSFKAVTAGIGAAVVAIGGLVAKSVSAYADFEQLKGGVETLFGAKGATSVEEYAKITGKSVDEATKEYSKLKDVESEVMKNANNAFRNAGLSANEYMETATSFSASLISSVGGDTAQAAKLADMAIVDMSDNANKMGTDMELIQNAYQGFAKGNYTMLDNLKLGYGGTKEEMQRLVKDAAKLDKSIDANSMSYGNIVKAIHAVQDEMYITGTTQKEAEKTITGSLGMVKSAWGNLLPALIQGGDQFDQCIENLVYSVEKFGENIMPAIKSALGGVVKMISGLAPMLVEALPGLVNELLPQVVTAATGIVDAIVQVLPKIIDGFVALIPQFIQAIVSMLPSLIQGITSLVTGIVNALPGIIQSIVDALPTILPALIQGIQSLVTSIAEALPQVMQTIVTALPDLIQTIVEALPTMIPTLINGIVNMFVILCQNFTAIIQPLISALPNIIITIVNALMANLPAIISGLITLTLSIVQNLPTIIQALIAALPTIVSSIVSGLLGCIPQLIQGLIQVIAGVVVALPQIFMSLVQGIGNIFVGIWDGICQTFSGFGDFFGGIWNTLTSGASSAWQGVQNVFGSVANFFGDIFGNAWETVKGVFSAGGKIFDGIKEGIVSTFKTVVNGIIKGINKVVSLPFEGLNGILDTISGLEIAGFKPFDWLTWRAPVPQIPELANGGLLTQPTLNVAGEAGPEMVVPLSKSRRKRGLDLWLQAGDALGVKQFANGGLVGKTYQSKDGDSRAISFKGDILFTDNVKELWNGIVQQFANGEKAVKIIVDTLINTVAELPEKMSVSLVQNGGVLGKALTEVWVDAVRECAEPVNKLLDGANHILKEFGSKKKVLSWTPYAKGTDGHKGGNALVNDGRGAELVQMPNGNTFIPRGRNVLLPNAPKGMKVLSAERTARLFGKKSATFRYANGVGEFDIWNYIDNPAGLINQIASTISYKGMSGLASNVGQSMVSTLSGEMSVWLKKLFEEEGVLSLADYVASKGVEQWRSTVIRALKMEGLYSAANVKRTLFQMQTESGGNPMAINLWDSNAKKGIPSKGLMQVIDPTFKAYARAGFDKNIYDPLSNILASVRYATSRYGSLEKAYRGVGYSNGVGTVTLPNQSSALSVSYTPENSFTGSKADVTENNTFSPVFNLTINGTSDGRAMERHVKRWVKESMDEIFRSMSRKSPRTVEI